MEQQRRLWIVGALAAASVVLARPAAAQYTDIVGATATQSRPATRYTTVRNNYLRLDVRLPGLVQTYGNPTATAPAPLLGYTNYRGGRAILYTAQGDPFTDLDDNVPICGPGNYSTWSVLQVKPISAPAAQALRNYEVETSYAPVDDPTQDIILAQPTATLDTVSFSWQIRELMPTAANPLNNTVTQANAGLAGSASPVMLRVTQSYRLIHNKVRVETLVQNVFDEAVLVGCQTYIDCNFGNLTAQQAAGRFHFEGVRSTVTQEKAFPSAVVTDPASMKVVPKSYRAFDDELHPALVLGGLLDGADVRTAALTAGVPSELLLLDQVQAGGAFLTYVPTGSTLTGSNMGVLARWRPLLLAVGQGRRFVTYYGLGGDSTSWGQATTTTTEQQAVVSVEAPFSLDLSAGDDPTTATIEAATNLYRTPNPFKVVGAVFNPTDRALSNIAVSLSLPSGFTLADPTQTLSRSIAVIGARTGQSVEWRVKAASTMAPGVRTLTLTASGPALPARAIQREIGIPALPALQFPNAGRRLDMVSVPYDFANRDIEHVLTSLGRIGVTGGGNAAVARYNPSGRAYAFFPDAFITNINPGEGIWLYNGSLVDLRLPTDRTQIGLDQAISVPLGNGWNQIGCPYTVPVRLYDCQVVTRDGLVRSFEEAVQVGLLRPTIYEYQPNEVYPSQPGSYLFSGDDSTKVNPWRGYWLRSLEVLNLVFNANLLIGPFQSSTNTRSPLALRDGWECTLTASAEGLGERELRVGRDAASSDGYDSRDVELPPPVRAQGDLRFAVLRDTWGRDAGRYVRDIASAAGRAARWRLEAEYDRPNTEVSLRWNLRGVPGNVQLTLVDLQSGARRHLRTTSSYTYNTGAFARTRGFELIASSGEVNVSVPFMGVTPTRGHSVAVNWTLTAPASAEVVVESLTGRRVRTVAAALAAPAGQNQATWDGRDDDGRPVPAGAYRCRVLVTTDDGQRAVAERMVVVGR